MTDIRNRVIALRIVPASELIPNPKNPREHPDVQIGALTEALEEIGFAGAMLARELTDAELAELQHSIPLTPAQLQRRLLLLDGHARQKIMGDTEVPVLVLDIAASEEGAFLLTFDPLTGLASYAKDRLRELIASVDLRRERLRQMVAEIAKKNRAHAEPGRTGNDPGADPSKATELRAKWKTETGQVWQIPSASLPSGVHRLLIADSALEATWETLHRHGNGELAECMWTDPPYGVNYQSIGDYMRDKKHRRGSSDSKTIEGDSKLGLRALFTSVFDGALRALTPGARWYIACGVRMELDLLTVLERLEMEHRQDLVWVKERFVFGRSDYHYEHEGIKYGITPNAPRPIGRVLPKGSGWYGDDSQTTVYRGPAPSKSEEHPTMKPPELVAAHIKNSTRVNDLVLEPFAGSGSTMVACEQLSRRCAAIEIDPGYAAVILDRMLGMGCRPALHKERKPGRRKTGV